MATTIQRATILGNRTTTPATEHGEVTITIPHATKAEIEITTPDQGTASVHNGAAEVFVASTSSDRTYRVRINQHGPVSCECAYCKRNPRKWRETPCVHVRAAMATLNHRTQEGKRTGSELRRVLTSLGWSRAKVDAKVRRVLRKCGGDVYSAAQLLQVDAGIRIYRAA